MSSHSSSPNESDRKSTKSFLKQLSRDFQSLSYRQLQHKAQLKERDAHFAKLEEELKLVKEKDEYTKKIKKSSHASSSKLNDSYGEESLQMNEYYQPQPRRVKRERKESPKEVRVDLPHFYGKENVETYLDWEIKVEQLFVCHHVSEERKVP